jgi:two-component system, chemotaxis family, chemotaxis protein CheY
MPFSLLLCDNTQLMRTVLQSVAVTGRFQVIGEATNGRRAVEQYAVLRPDVVVMDIVMRELSGGDVVREILELDPDARIVMTGAMGQLQFVAEALAAGARGFITRPFTASRVVEALADALGDSAT